MKGNYLLVLLGVFLLCAVIPSTLSEPVGTCPSTNGEAPEYLTDSEDCSIFYECSWGEAVRLKCGDNLYFNPANNACDWPENVDCGSNGESGDETTELGSNDVETTDTAESTEDLSGDGCVNADCPFYPEPPANVTFFPHDTDCSRYCMCDWYGVAHDMPCPSGLYWNSELDTCDWPSNVDCDNSNLGTTEDNTGEDTTTATTTLATNTTDNATTTDAPTEATDPPTTEDVAEATTHAPTESTEASATTEEVIATDPTTDIPTETTDSSSEATSASNDGCTNADCPFYPEPPANVTFFPHDTDCSRYCMCDWYGVAHDMPCPSGLYWNSELDTCDWPSNVDCDNSNLGTTEDNTGEDTTTATTTLATNTTDNATTTDAPTEATDPPTTEDVAEATTRAPTKSTEAATTTEIVATDPTTDTPTETTDSSSEATSASNDGCNNADCPLYPEPPANVTFFPHAIDCSRYCMCDWYGVAHDMPCPTGLYWNSELDTCDWSSNVDCDNSNSGTTEDNTGEDTTTAATDNGNVNTTTTAPTNTTESATTTDAPTKSTEAAATTEEVVATDPTTDTPTETAEPYTATTSTSNDGCTNADCPLYPEPPANVTFFPHDTDCGRYCMCDWFGVAHDMRCPEGLHWNTKLNTCDWANDAGCQ